MSIVFLDEGGASDGGPSAAARRPSWRVRWGWLVIIAALVAATPLLAIPGYVREARKTRCVGQLKRLGVVLAAYHEAHGHFPAAAITDGSGRPLLSWRVAILPQLGYRSLYAQFRLDEPWDSPHNRALASRMPPIYACPSLADRRPFATGYQVVVGPKPVLGEVGTLFEWSRGVEIREVLDGTSNTLMVAEVRRPIPWTQPDDPRYEPGGALPSFGSGHPGGFHAVFADGATRFLKSSIASETLGFLLTCDGLEVLGGG